MKQERRVLNKMTLADIVRSIILLKPGKRNFLIEELKEALEKATMVYERLDNADYDALSKLFFWDEEWLHGEWDLPHYRLSEEGKKNYEKRLKEEYGPDILSYVQPLADKAWKS